MSSWADALGEIGKSLNVINRAIEAIGNGYKTGVNIADSQSLRNVRSRLSNLISEMSGLNADKVILNRDIDAHLRGKERHSWEKLQEHLHASAAHIGAVCNAVQAASRDIIKLTNLNLHTNLVAALRIQQQEYEKLASLPKPNSRNKKAATAIAKKLGELLEEVRALETTLDAQSHGPKPN